MMRMLDRVGRATTDFFEYAGGLTLLSVESAGFIVRLRVRAVETISRRISSACNRQRSSC
jgi:hypothetical protein